MWIVALFVVDKFFNENSYAGVLDLETHVQVACETAADGGIAFVQRLVFSEDCVYGWDTLGRSLPLLRDAWQRAQRSQPPTEAVGAGIAVLYGRLLRRGAVLRKQRQEPLNLCPARAEGMAPVPKRRWARSCLSPVAGVQSWLQLLEKERADIMSLPMFWRMFVVHASEKDQGMNDGGAALDVPSWVRSIFENGVLWTADQVLCLMTALAQDFPVTRPVAAHVERESKQMAPDCVLRYPKPAPFGRCLDHPSCMMVPWLVRTGPHAGRLWLVCRRWTRFKATRDKRCFRREEFPMDKFDTLPSHLRRAFKALPAAFARGKEELWT